MNQKGFTTIELLIVVVIIALITLGATMTVSQVLPGTERGNDRIASACQAQDAGYWISYDGQMADNILTDGLVPPNVLVLTWTERNYDGGGNIYHSVTYSVQDISGYIGRLRRAHWSSGGANEQVTVAEHIYYNPEDTLNTSKASYQDPVLAMQLTSRLGEASITREYRVVRRPNF